MQQHHVRVLGPYAVERRPDTMVIAAIDAARKSDLRALRQ
jgi:hypothetical protein